MNVAILEHHNPIKRYNKAIFITGIMLVVIMVSMCITTAVYAVIGAGGYVSEKLIGGSGFYTIGYNGQSLLVYGEEATISTLAPTNIKMTDSTHATLNGNIADLGDVTNINIYFEWGYDTSYGNVVGSSIACIAGSYNTVISHFDPDRTVHYRFVTYTGTSYTYGGDETFSIVGSVAGSSASYSTYQFANAIYPLFFLMVGIIFVFLFIRNAQANGEQGTKIIFIVAITLYIILSLLPALQELIRNLW